VELHQEIHGLGSRWATPDLKLLACTRVDNGDVRVSILVFMLLEVILDILLSSRVIFGVLHENEVFLDSLLDPLVLPDIAIKSLAVENGRVLNVYQYPLLLLFAEIARIVPGKS